MRTVDFHYFSRCWVFLENRNKISTYQSILMVTIVTPKNVIKIEKKLKRQTTLTVNFRLLR